MNTKEKIAAKIEALRNRTTARGCTEAEALEAARKAAQLMAEYEIEEGEIGLRREAGNCKAVWVTYQTYGKVTLASSCARRVALLFGCRVWQNGGAVAFFGMENDADFAGMVFNTLAISIRTEMEAFRKTSDFKRASELGAHAKTLMASFIIGMENRLNVRLHAMLTEKDAASRTSTGTDLVIVKSAIVEAEFAKQGITIGKAKKTNRTVRAFNAYEAGQAAGERVSLGGNANQGLLL